MKVERKICSSHCSPPFLTRYSARSVANMSADRPDFILDGLSLMVEMTPVAILMQSLTVSTESNISCQASWKSLLYVVGVPYTLENLCLLFWHCTCILLMHVWSSTCSRLCHKHDWQWTILTMTGQWELHLHHCHHACKIALDSPSLTPNQLQSVWILLLGHQTAACINRKYLLKIHGIVPNQ